LVLDGHRHEGRETLQKVDVARGEPAIVAGHGEHADDGLLARDGDGDVDRRAEYDVRLLGSFGAGPDLDGAAAQRATDDRAAERESTRARAPQRAERVRRR